MRETDAKVKTRRIDCDSELRLRLGDAMQTYPERLKHTPPKRRIAFPGNDGRGGSHRSLKGPRRADPVRILSRLLEAPSLAAGSKDFEFDCGPALGNRQGSHGRGCRTSTIERTYGDAA